MNWESSWENYIAAQNSSKNNRDDLWIKQRQAKIFRFGPVGYKFFGIASKRRSQIYSNFGGPEQ